MTEEGRTLMRLRGGGGTTAGKGERESQAGSPSRGRRGRGGGGKRLSLQAEDADDDEEDDEDEDGVFDAHGLRTRAAGRGGGKDTDTVVAIARKGEVLGMACFKEEESTIFIAQILASGDVREIIQSLKIHLEPNIFLIDPHTLQCEDFCSLLSSSVSEDRQEFEIKVLKTRAWDYNGSIKNICLSLKVKALMQTEDDESAAGGGQGGGEGATGQRMMYDRLSSVLNFSEEPEAVRALGALVIHLQSTTFQLEPSASVPVRTISRYDLGCYVRMDPSAFSSLQVFHTETHPNVIGGKGRAKEGFSLFGLLDQTRSKVGRKTLKEWLLKPLRNIEQITQRQDAIELFMQPDTTETIANIRRFLSKIADVGRCLNRLRRVQANFRDWLKVHQTLQHSILVHNCLAALLHSTARANHAWSSALTPLIQRFSLESLARSLETVSQVIDMDVTKETREMTIRGGCDEELDRLKATYDELEDFLTAEARTVLYENPRIQSLSVQFLPQIGYLVAISCDQRTAVADDVTFKFAFAQDDKLYYKTPRMHQLDDDVGDLLASIKDLQDRLIRDLTAFILDEEVPLLEAVRACAEVDTLISMSQMAQGLNWSRPTLTEERVIIVKDGRHPLQELTVESYVPNDIFLSKERSLAIITGPNFSGKSVYIKQVATAVFLAHCGSFLPCDKAVIGLTDGIYTRIASAETCSVQQSTFTIDLLQMNTIFKNATENSIVIVDELGKGSAEIDGQALLVASIHELQRLQARTLITTHFLEVLHDDQLIPRSVVEDLCYRMDVFIPPQDASQLQSYNTIVPLFKLTKGCATASDGLSCAVLAGLPLIVVRRAEHIIQSRMAGTLVQALPHPLLPSSHSQQQRQHDEEQGIGLDVTHTAGGGGQEPYNVITFNKAAGQSLERFLAIEDWTRVDDAELQAFLTLLRSACCSSSFSATTTEGVHADDEANHEGGGGESSIGGGGGVDSTTN